MILRGILTAVGGAPMVELQRIVPGGCAREEARFAGTSSAANIVAALEARALYPELHAPDAPWPANDPLPPRGVYLVACLNRGDAVD